MFLIFLSLLRQWNSLIWQQRVSVATERLIHSIHSFIAAFVHYSPIHVHPFIMHLWGSHTSLKHFLSLTEPVHRSEWASHEHIVPDTPARFVSPVVVRQPSPYLFSFFNTSSLVTSVNSLPHPTSTPNRSLMRQRNSKTSVWLCKEFDKWALSADVFAFCGTKVEVKHPDVMFK